MQVIDEASRVDQAQLRKMQEAMLKVQLRADGEKHVGELVRRSLAAVVVASRNARGVTIDQVRKYALKCDTSIYPSTAYFMGKAGAGGYYGKWS